MPIGLSINYKSNQIESNQINESNQCTHAVWNIPPVHSRSGPCELLLRTNHKMHAGILANYVPQILFTLDQKVDLKSSINGFATYVCRNNSLSIHHVMYPHDEIVFRSGLPFCSVSAIYYGLIYRIFLNIIYVASYI